MATIKRPGSASVFFGRLFQARDEAHLIHLSLRGPGAYAQHKALGSFYEDLLDLTDTLIEAYQGIYGIQSINIPESSSYEPIMCLTNLYNYIEDSRSTFKESFLQNIVDEIQQLIASTLYKLKNLS